MQLKIFSTMWQLPHNLLETRPGTAQIKSPYHEPAPAQAYSKPAPAQAYSKPAPALAFHFKSPSASETTLVRQGMETTLVEPMEIAPSLGRMYIYPTVTLAPGVIKPGTIILPNVNPTHAQRCKACQLEGLAPCDHESPREIAPTSKVEILIDQPIQDWVGAHYQ